MTVSFRLYRKDDLNSVIVLANKYAAFDGFTSEADLAVTSHFPEGFWIAEDEGKIVGFVYGYFKDVPAEVLERWRATKVGYVQLMAVAPNHRHRGIGRSLLSKLLSEFNKAGADLVLLDCPAEAVEARRMYEKIGFDTRSYGMKKRL
jgi:[ribosomal protein S18]-alanine N-acetyltransferase